MLDADISRALSELLSLRSNCSVISAALSSLNASLTQIALSLDQQPSQDILAAQDSFLTNSQSTCPRNPVVLVPLTVVIVIQSQPASSILSQDAFSGYKTSSMAVSARCTAYMDLCAHVHCRYVCRRLPRHLPAIRPNHETAARLPTTTQGEQAAICYAL